MKDTTNINQTICDFIARGIALHWIHPLDTYYATNRLLNLLDKDYYDTSCQSSIPLPELVDVMDELVVFMQEKGLIDESNRQKEEAEAQIMDIITPAPSVVNRDFWENYREAPMRATDEFYELSRENDYIKTRHIAKNEQFKYDSKYGELGLTINLSKPEKTKKDIEEARHATGNYPNCQLCAENEGYKGRVGIAGRTNHRIIRVPIANENWGFQYSPYSYYNEHCIVFTKKHIPMNVNHHTIANLLELISILPHYFMGSNAGLPIVGGSMLAHEHYQGGRHHFPMEDAKVTESWQWAGLESVTAERLHWPLSVIRLRSLSPENLVEAGSKVMEAWNTYTNEELDILAETEAGKHNAVTLITRRKDHAYELDVVLRNNRTTEAFPDGIFHPHKDVQHIKQENIGLIEVLGLAILPPRLKQELADVAAYLLNEKDSVANYHQEWADELKAAHKAESLDEARATAIVQAGAGAKFERVLEDAGVFKHTDTGQAAFHAFVQAFQE